MRHKIARHRNGRNAAEREAKREATNRLHRIALQAATRCGWCGQRHEPTADTLCWFGYTGTADHIV